MPVKAWFCYNRTMLKKILFSLLCILMIYSNAVAAYRIFEPRQEHVALDSSSFISYASLKEYIVSSGESSQHFLFFYNDGESDSLYVRTSVLSDVKAKTGLDLDRLIEIVDLSGYRQENLPASLAQDWGLSDYPSFALVTLKDGQIQVLSRLEWSAAAPITSPMLIQWLKDNGIYNSSHS